MGTRPVTFFALKNRVPLKGMITGVVVRVEVDQLKLKIPSVFDGHRLVRRRPGGERGETENSLSVLLSFDVKSLPNKVMLGYISYPIRA